MQPDNVLRASLAISAIEAQTGTSRELTLPNGSKVHVAIPGGTQNGQILRIDGRETGYNTGGAATTLELAITIAGDDSKTFISQGPEQTDATASMTFVSPDRLAGSNPQGPTPIPNNWSPDALTLGPVSQPGNPATSTSSTAGSPLVLGAFAPPPSPQGTSGMPPASSPYYPYGAPAQGPDRFNNLTPGTLVSNSQQLYPQKKSSRGKALLLVILALLVIISGVGAFYILHNNPTIANGSNGTPTSQTQNTPQQNLSGTQTAQTNQSDATATNAASTQTAQTSATAQAQASATAQANATSTASVPVVVPTPSPTTPPSAPFHVLSVTLAVSPTSIAGMACGTMVTVNYTATITVAAHSPGGTVQLEYTVNNGRGSTNDTLTFGPGQTTKTYVFTWSGNLPADHTYPGNGILLISSPNALQSNGAQPAGQCS